MDIPVDDQDSFQREVLDRILCADRHIVEEAESHGPVSFRMVTRRPHQGKSIIQPSFHHSPDQLQQAPGREKGGIIRFSTGGGIHIEPAVGLSCGLRHLVDVSRSMDQFQLLPCGRT